jgi:hypothetical protein
VKAAVHGSSSSSSSSSMGGAAGAGASSTPPHDDLLELFRSGKEFAAGTATVPQHVTLFFGYCSTTRPGAPIMGCRGDNGSGSGEPDAAEPADVLATTTAGVAVDRASLDSFLATFVGLPAVSPKTTATPAQCAIYISKLRMQGVALSAKAEAARGRVERRGQGRGRGGGGGGGGQRG